MFVKFCFLFYVLTAVLETAFPPTNPPTQEYTYFQRNTGLEMWQSPTPLKMPKTFPKILVPMLVSFGKQLLIYDKIIPPCFDSLGIKQSPKQRTPHPNTGKHQDSKVSINVYHVEL